MIHLHRLLQIVLLLLLFQIEAPPFFPLLLLLHLSSDSAANANSLATKQTVKNVP
jgi:hypothetical protein